MTDYTENELQLLNNRKVTFQYTINNQHDEPIAPAVAVELPIGNVKTFDQWQSAMERRGVFYSVIHGTFKRENFARRKVN